MYGFEIILIVVGLLIIVISFMLTDKSGQVTEYAVDESFIDRELEKINGKVDSIIDAKREEIIETTDDKLADASNEKIIEFKEYTDQVIEKIDRNHQEVVFLYDMLDKKNNELKETLKMFNDSKAQLEVMLTETEKYVASNVVNSGVNYKKTEVNKKTVDVQTGKSNINQSNKHSGSVFTNEVKNVVEKNVPEKKTKATKKVKNEEVKTAVIPSNKDLNSNSDNQEDNDKIIMMYKQGKSIVEISKLLGRGQGEVKLIINLYKSGKE